MYKIHICDLKASYVYGREAFYIAFIRTSIQGIKEGGRTFMAKVELKQPVIAEISDLLDGAQTAVVVDYRGLTVEQDTVLRKQLREAGITYKVYKNTMIRFAAKGTPFEALEPNLEGPTALAVSKTDATAPARIIANFAKTAPKLEIKGGIVEDTYYDAKGMQVIATIPSREELLGKLLGSIQSPITNLARVLNQIAEAKAEA
jgi:large subunit ribosomal protein L10